MRDSWADEATIRRILDRSETWAIIGLAEHPWRPAYGVARFLQRHGKRIIPVHPTAAKVLGEPGVERLSDIDRPVDCVDVFRRSEAAGEFVDQAIAIGASAVWFQLGVIDADAFDRARGAGLDMVMDRCPAIEWSVNGPPA